MVSSRQSKVPSSKLQCRAGQSVPPRRLRPPCGSISHPQKVPAIILGTESHGENSKEHNYPRPHDYSLYCRVYQRISQPPREPPGKRPNPTADQPHEQCSHLLPPRPRAKWGKQEPLQGFQARQENRSLELQCFRYLPESHIPAISSPMLHPTPRHDRNSKATQRT